MVSCIGRKLIQRDKENNPKMIQILRFWSQDAEQRINTENRSVNQILFLNRAESDQPLYHRWTSNYLKFDEYTLLKFWFGWMTHWK